MSNVNASSRFSLYSAHINRGASRRNQSKLEIRRWSVYIRSIEWGDFGSRGDFGNFSEKRLKLL